jgi:hypothetical protein
LGIHGIAHSKRGIQLEILCVKTQKASKEIQNPLRAYRWHLPESLFHGFLQKVKVDGEIYEILSI